MLVASDPLKVLGATCEIYLFERSSTVTMDVPRYLFIPLESCSMPEA